MVTNQLFAGVAVCLFTIGSVSGQTTRVIPWSDGNLDEFSISVNAYHPEPVIFVHGITASRVKWENIIANLHSPAWFQTYHYRNDLFESAKESSSPPVEGYTDQELSGSFPSDEKNQWRDIEQPYLHTFNYGRHAKRLPDGTTRSWTRVRVSRQSHDPVDWNSWQAPGNDYFQSRTTLNQRVDTIRSAYRMPGEDAPNVVLIGHSLGGLQVCNYLMTKNDNLGADAYVPVRRAITIDSLLWGSPLANLLANWDNNFFNPALALYKRALELGSGIAGQSMAVWIENHAGVTKDALAVDLEDAVAKGSIPQIATTHFLATGGSFQQKLHSTEMPTTTEFVTSGAKNLSPPPVQLLLGRATGYHDLKVALDGDGAVPLESMAGYHGNGTPVFANLAPVDIRGYTNGNWNTNWVTDHGKAPEQMGIYPHLLDGVQYRSGSHTDGPGIWSGLQKQYTNAPTESVGDVTLTHTDEPGFRDMILLYPRANQNPLVIPTVDTWIVSSGAWQKVSLTASNFAGFQIVVGSNGDPLQCVGTMGVKNRSENPVGMEGTNYWVIAGNEYLPASLKLQAAISNAPLPVLTNLTAAVTGAVNQCLVQLDENGAPQFQYGVFTNTGNVSVILGTNNYVAVQGQNLGGLLTPQAERAFDVPVNAVTLAEILGGINARQESLATATNDCVCLESPTNLWTATVTEWITVTNSTAQLNFFAAENNFYWEDPFLHVALAVELFSYSPTNRTVTFTDTNALPSIVTVQYPAHLGGYHIYSNLWSGGSTVYPIPEMQASTLAGVPITEGFVQQMRGALEAMIPRYKDTHNSEPRPWTLASVLAQIGNDSGNWTEFTNSLVTAEHITEMRDVLDQLTALWEQSTEQGGLWEPATHGWQDVTAFTTNGWSAKFVFENSSSEGCNGSNSDMQWGRICRKITFTTARSVTYSVNGNVETVDSGYDLGRILRKGTVMTEIMSTENGSNCTMQAKSASTNEVLQAGTYLFTFEANTRDGAWHQNMTHNFSITITAP